MILILSIFDLRMAHICLQFGQCGNQLGSELFSLIHEDITNSICKHPNLINDSYTNISLDSWFSRENNTLQARAILIDTEEKVVKEIHNHSNWCYNPDNVIIDNSGGSANNWAVGYNLKGPQILDQALEALRKECEKCDRLEGFLTINSSAGGSGSGICSYFTQQVQNEFSNKTFISVLVLPYITGEVVTQNYNTLFSLSKLNNTCDATIIFQNDHLHSMLTSYQDIKNVEFTALNRLIAEQVGSVMQPVLDHNGTTKRLKFSELTCHLCAHPNYKLLSIRTAPQVIHQVSNFQSSFKWNSLQHCELEMCTQKNPYYRTKHSDKKIYVKAVANMLINRGKPSIVPVNDYKPQVSNNSIYSISAQNNSSLLSYVQSRKYMKMDQFVTLITNNSSVHYDLNHILDSAWLSFTNKSFIYLYEKYGVTKEDFLEAFFNVENINQLYKAL